MSHSSLLHDGALRETIAAYFEDRAAAIDSGALGVRDGIAWLNREILGGDGHADSPNHDLLHIGRTLATVAWSDMSSAFALWCHRMVLEYLAQAPEGSSLRTGWLPKLCRTELLGSTALASGMAHVVTGAPLPVTGQAVAGGYRISGKIPWASNMQPPEFFMVTVAQTPDGPVVVALEGGNPALQVAPHPVLLALQATFSSSAEIVDAEIDPAFVLSRDAVAFVKRLRPTILLMQSCFALGLAARSLHEAAAAIRGVNSLFTADLDALTATADRLAAFITRAVASRGLDLPVIEVVRARYEAACLTTAATALEAKVQGGRGYQAASPTARRQREAAFLPIQAPTEGQLRWELSNFG